MHKMMRHNVHIEIDIQNVSEIVDIPEFTCFQDWVLSALAKQCDEAEVTVRIVDVPEMTALNTQFRGQNKPTNVLAFPLETAPLVGDVVICAPVVVLEAKVQKKSLKAHWAHLTIHGILHLLGYDHMTSVEAEQMEGLEIDLLKKLGFPNPYKAY